LFDACSTETDDSEGSQRKELEILLVLTVGIGVGAVIYLAGTLLGDGPPAIIVRRIGWVIMTALLPVPSTFSLLLPAFATLAATLRQPPRRRPLGQRPEPSV
jgi:hypothetical protein